MITRPFPSDFKQMRIETAQYLHALLALTEGRKGKFVLSSFNDGMSPESVHVENGPDAFGKTTAVFDRWRDAKRNAYIALALYRSDLPEGARGKEADIVSVLGLVGDFDKGHSPETFRERMPVAPSIVVETSAGNFQAAILFAEPVAPEVAKCIAEALKRATACDTCTKDIDHVWRIPGTWNRPNRKKIAEGRSPDPQPCRMHECIDTWEERITADALRAAILQAKPNAFDAATSDATGSNDAAFDWEQRVRPNDPRTTLSDAAILKALNKEGDRSKLACNFIVRLKRNNYSPEEIGETMTSYSYTLVMGHYMEHPSGFTDALDADVKRIFSKLLVSKDTSKVFRVDDIRLDDDDKPEYPPARRIEIKGGALPEHVDAGEAALAEQKLPVFQRGGLLVQPVDLKIEVRGGKAAGDLVIGQVGPATLVEQLTAAADWNKFDGRSNEYRRTDCPRAIADTLLGRAKWDRLRVLTAVANTPTMRPDGTILDMCGYDPATGVLLDTRGVEYPPIPLHPTRDHALGALAIFDELIGRYPFETREDRAVALSGFLTAPIRRMLSAAPLIGINANGAGSGKSKLADAIAIEGNGHPASSITVGANEEELDKRLHSLLLRGDLTICIDNVTDAIVSDFLCSALTQEWVDVRPLGTSKTAKAPTRCMFIATGNGLTYAGDLNRRALTCSIDPRCEDPSARQFDFDPVERAREGRIRYVVAALTVLRAYQAAGRPAQKGKVMGGYSEWCRTVRDALLWLSEADPVATCHPVSADDPERERFAAVVKAWNTAIGTTEAASAREALTKAMAPGPEALALLDAFKAIAPSATLGRKPMPSSLRAAVRKCFRTGPAAIIALGLFANFLLGGDAFGGSDDEQGDVAILTVGRSIWHDVQVREIDGAPARQSMDQALASAFFGSDSEYKLRPGPHLFEIEAFDHLEGRTRYVNSFNVRVVMSANAHYRFRLDERTKGVVFEIVDGTSARAIGTIVRRAAVLNLPTINSTTGYPAAPNTVPHPAKPIANTPAAMSFDQWEKSHPPGGN